MIGAPEMIRFLLKQGVSLAEIPRSEDSQSSDARCLASGLPAPSVLISDVSAVERSEPRRSMCRSGDFRPKMSHNASEILRCSGNNRACFQISSCQPDVTHEKLAGTGRCEASRSSQAFELTFCGRAFCVLAVRHVKLHHQHVNLPSGYSCLVCCVACMSS